MNEEKWDEKRDRASEYAQTYDEEQHWCIYLIAYVQRAEVIGPLVARFCFAEIDELRANWKEFILQNYNFLYDITEKQLIYTVGLISSCFYHEFRLASVIEGRN